MAQQERLSNLGYGAMKPETTIGVPVTPDIFFPIYKESLTLDMKNDMDNPVMGVRSNPYADFPGLREFTGSLTVMGEPNTMENWLDMLLAAGDITGGSDPYTHPYTEGLSKSYTIELLKGQVVHRFFGVMADSLTPTFNKNKMELEVAVSALGAFLSASITNISTITLTLDKTFQSNPNLGLVVGDAVSVIDPTGMVDTLNTTIASGGVNANGYQVTLSDSAAAFSNGAILVLAAQTPSYSLLTPFLWAKTQFCFADTAADAISAAQTNIEDGSKWKLTHNFESKGGAHRSGNFNPASLPRTQTEADLTVKKFFDVPDDLDRFQRTAGWACVIRHFSGATNQHELRITLNNIIQKTSKRPLESGKIIYNEIDYTGVYSTGDGQAFSVKVINANAS